MNTAPLVLLCRCVEVMHAAHVPGCFMNLLGQGVEVKESSVSAPLQSLGTALTVSPRQGANREAL